MQPLPRDRSPLSSVLAHGQFRALWCVGTLHEFARRMELLVLSWLILQVTDSYFQLGAGPFLQQRAQAASCSLFRHRSRPGKQAVGPLRLPSRHHPDSTGRAWNAFLRHKYREALDGVLRDSPAGREPCIGRPVAPDSDTRRGWRGPAGQRSLTGRDQPYRGQNGRSDTGGASFWTPWDFRAPMSSSSWCIW